MEKGGDGRGGEGGEDSEGRGELLENVYRNMYIVL